MKTCSKCKLSKSLDDFHKSKRLSQGRRSWCKVCERDQHKEWVEINPEKVAVIDKRYAKANPDKCQAKKKRWSGKYPEKVNAHRLKAKYGISIDQYRAMFNLQKDKCALCKRSKEEFELGLHVDHNHASDKVRGLLCPSCNQGIGLLQDNPDLCRAAALYIENDGKAIEHIIGETNGKETSSETK